MKYRIVTLLAFVNFLALGQAAIRPNYGYGECPYGVESVQCLINPCRGKTCPSHPYAVCRPSRCGPCEAHFYDGYGTEVQCDDCPGVLNCVINACRFPECPSHTQAECRTTCNGCISHYYDTYDNEIKCDCPSGKLVETKCKSDLCDNEVCNGYPNAECRISRCGGCHTEFYDYSGQQVQCNPPIEDPKCPRFGPPGHFLCHDDCSSSDDCVGNLVCCKYGCKRMCVSPQTVYDPMCPKVELPKYGICKRTCYSNDDCRRGQICCANSCGSQCQDRPLDVACPPPDPEIIKIRPLIFCPAPTCLTNDDCKGNDLCCSNGCTQRCRSPPFVDPTCPKVYGEIGPCVNLCRSNLDCEKYDQICCGNGCGTQCKDKHFYYGST